MKLEELEGKIDDVVVGMYRPYDLREILIGECKRLARSGAINLEEAEDNYRVPMILITVALENISSQYSPPTESDQKIIENLRKF